MLGGMLPQPSRGVDHSRAPAARWAGPLYALPRHVPCTTHCAQRRVRMAPTTAAAGCALRGPAQTFPWHDPSNAASATCNTSVAAAMWSACASTCQRQPRQRQRGASQSAAAVAVAVVPPAPAATAATAAVGAAMGGGLSEAIAVVLGYAVLIGSLFRSAPQIVKVVKARSCEGLSLTSVIVELLCYSVVVAYNLSQGYPFNTFGEVAACWIQDIILIALILRFSHAPGWQAVAVFGALAALSAWLLSPACPSGTLAALQASTILTMALGSRLPQIVLNWRRGNAGMLSVISCGLNVAGNAARIFTTLVLTRDPLLLGGILTQGTMNCILLYQSIDTSLRRKRGLLPSTGKGPHKQQQQQLAGLEPRPAPVKSAADSGSVFGDNGSCGTHDSTAPPLIPQPAA